MFVSKLLTLGTGRSGAVKKLARPYGSCECGSGTGGSKEPSAPILYESRKYGHNLPCDNVVPFFEALPHFPTGIFRCTVGEVLGQGANKGCQYQNPEYFSFHHMTFYDMHMLLRCYRRPCPKTGRKK